MSASVLVLILTTGGAGLWASHRLSDALAQSECASTLLRDHMQADMMHDALRADVLAALLTTRPGSGIRLDEVRQDVKAHAAEFRSAIASEHRLAGPDTRAVVDALDQPLAAYIASAEQMVSLAASDPDAVVGRMDEFLARFSALEEMMGAASDKLAAAQSARTATAHALSRTAMLGLSGAMALGLVLAMLGVTLIDRRLVQPLVRMARAMSLLADGRSDVEVEGQSRGDEIGAMAKATETFRANQIEKAALEAEAADQRRRADEDRAAAEREREAAAREQAGIVDALARGLGELSQGNLATSIDAAFPAAYEKLRSDFNATANALAATLEQVRVGADGIRNGTDEIAHAADDLSRRTEQQAASLEQTAGALDEIVATVNKTASGAREASATVTRTKSEAVRSGEVVAQAVDAMDQIESSSQQISQIIGVIDEIAFQTNLLALNAGVEAARAGDAGKGFAVVAAEVRALAQRSAEAAKEIKALISASSEHVGKGVGLVGETGRALRQIVQQVDEIDKLVSEIAASAQEQAIGLAEVNTAVDQMDQVVQQNAAMVEQSTAATHALKSETAAVAQLIERFRTRAATEGGKEAAPPAPVARATSARPIRTRGNAALKVLEESWAEF